MINNPTFIEAMNQYGREIAPEIYLTDSASPAYDMNSIYSINVSYDGKLLSSSMKALEFKVDGQIEIAKGSEIFNVKMGARASSNDDYSFVAYGAFVCSEVAYDADADISTAKAYDHIIDSQVSYDGTLTYPTTLTGLLGQICTKFGWTLDPDAALLNGSKAIASEKYDSTYTWRDILDDISAASGCSLGFLGDKYLHALYPISSAETLDGDSLKACSMAGTFGPITSIVFGRDPVEDSVMIRDINGTGSNHCPDTANWWSSGQYSETTGEIEDCDYAVYLTSKLRATLAAPIFSTRLAGYQFHVIEYDVSMSFIAAHTVANGDSLVLDSSTKWLGLSIVASDTSKTWEDISGILGSTLLPYVHATASDTYAAYIEPDYIELRADNVMLADDNREDWLPAVFEQWYGKAYGLQDIETSGLGYMEPLDEFEVSLKGHVYTCLWLQDTLDISDGVTEKSKIESYSTDAGTDYTVATDSERAVTQAYVKVNKVDGTVTALSQDVSANSNSIAQLQLTTQQIQSSVVDNVNNLQTQITQNQSSIEAAVSKSYTDLSGQISTISTSFIVDEDGAKIKKSDSTNYTLVSDDGVYLYVDDTEVAKASVDGFRASSFLTGDWCIQPTNDGNTLNFFKKG